MKRLLVLLVLSVLVVTTYGGGYKKRGRRDSTVTMALDSFLVQDSLKLPNKYSGFTARPTKALPLTQLPREFTWCEQDGKSYCGPSWNQHIPQYCGACWVHGTLSALNDRINIGLNANSRTPVPHIILARQVILNCAEARGFGTGCNGGESWDVFEYMRQYGLPDETCANYKAESSTQCTPEGECANCMIYDEDALPHCWPVKKYARFYVKEYGVVKGEAAIMSEILKNGPVTCGAATPDEFGFGYTGGVWNDTSGSADIDHDVEVVGWGEEHGVKYWHVRNSWGTYWGENGFFRVVRGTNNMHLEEACAFGVVDFHELEEVLIGKKQGSMFGLVNAGEEPQHYLNNWEYVPHQKPEPEDAETPPGSSPVELVVNEPVVGDHAPPRAAAAETEAVYQSPTFPGGAGLLLLAVAVIAIGLVYRTYFTRRSSDYTLI